MAPTPFAHTRTHLLWQPRRERLVYLAEGDGVGAHAAALGIGGVLLRRALLGRPAAAEADVLVADGAQRLEKGVERQAGRCAWEERRRYVLGEEEEELEGAISERERGRGARRAREQVRERRVRQQQHRLGRRADAAQHAALFARRRRVGVHVLEEALDEALGARPARGEHGCHQRLRHGLRERREQLRAHADHERGDDLHVQPVGGVGELALHERREEGLDERAGKEGAVGLGRAQLRH